MSNSNCASLPRRFVRVDGKVPVSDFGIPIDPYDSRYWRPREAIDGPAGFVLNGDGYFLLDLDACGNGETWSPKAQAICAAFPGAAIEASRSGRGLHLMGRCDPTQFVDRRNRWEGWLEFYTDRRLVVLGHGWTGDVTLDHTPALLALVPVRETPEAMAQAGTCPVEDAAVLDRLLRSQGAAARFGVGVTPAELWEARADRLAAAYPTSAPGEPYDRSAADAALMRHLAFWTHRDPAAMDRLFRRSALMRAKYESREDYRERTIAGAIGICREVADWSRGTPVLPEPVGEAAAVRGYLRVQDQIDHFAGCTYVADVHCIAVPDGRLLSSERFRVEFGGHEFAMQADGARPTRNAFEAFTESRAHRFPRAKTSTLRPDRAFGEIIGDGAANLYRKPPAPRPGDVTPFLDHVAYLIPDERDRLILLQWLGRVVQRVGVPVRWAPVLVGPPGNGKSFVARCVVEAIGPTYCHIVQPREISATHNGWIHGRLFAQVEEIDTRERRDAIEILKPFITDPRINVRAMNKDSVTAENVMNWFFCTNHEGGVPKIAGDRRYAVFHTNAEVRAEDYFKRLYGWAEAGGFEHVAHHLLTLDMGDMPIRAPNTSSTADAIHASLGNAEIAVLDAIEDGRPGTRGGWLSTLVVKQIITEATGRTATPRMIGSVLNNLGFRQIMRASRVVLNEGGQPRLYARDDRPAVLDHYISAQGYVPSPLAVVP